MRKKREKRKKKNKRKNEIFLYKPLKTTHRNKNKNSEEKGNIKRN